MKYFSFGLFAFATFMVILCSCSVKSLPPLQGQALIDSLGKELSKAKEDSNKVNIFNRLYDCFYTFSNDSALKYSDSAVNLAVSLHWDKGIANSYNNLGKSYYNIGNFNKSMECFKSAYKLRQQIGDSFGAVVSNGNIAAIYNAKGDYNSALNILFNNVIFYKNVNNNNSKINLCKTYNNMVISFRKKNDYKNALNYDDTAIQLATQTHSVGSLISIYLNKAQVLNELGSFSESIENNFLALKMADSLNDKNSISKARDNIGTIYLEQRNYTEAINNHQEALKIMEKLPDSIGIVIELNNIGLAYFYQQNFDTALKFYNHALNIEKRITLNSKTDERIAAAYNNIGTVYKEWKNYDTALNLYFKSLEISDSIPDLKQQSINLTDIGEIYYIRSEYIFAEKYYDSALSISNSINFYTNIREINFKLSGMYTQLGITSKAFESYKKYAEAKDIILNDSSLKKIIATQVHYEDERKQSLAKEEEKRKADIDRKNKEREHLLEWSAVIALVGSFIIFVTTLYYQVYLIARRFKKSEDNILKFIENLGIFTLIMTYECISLFIDQSLEKFTHDKLLLMFFILVICGIIIVPVHEKIEEIIRKRLKLIARFIKEVKFAFNSIKQDFQLLETEKKIPKLFNFIEGDKVNIFSFKAINIEYYIKAKLPVNGKIIYLETHKLLMTKEKKVDETIHELTAIYFMDDKNYHNMNSLLKFKLPENFDESEPNSSLAKEYVNTIWENVIKPEKEKLDQIEKGKLDSLLQKDNK